MHTERKCNKQSIDISQAKEGKVKQRGLSQRKNLWGTKLPTESWADIAQVYTVVVLTLNTSHINARSVIRVLDVHIAFGDMTLYIQTRGPISASTVENPLMIVGIVVNMEDSMNRLSSSANLKAKELRIQI